MDTSWSETGDRYLLKLFRDYVFHQTDERGRPWIDMAHIVACLNKVIYLRFPFGGGRGSAVIQGEGGGVR